MTTNNPAYKTWLDSLVNPYESITVLEKSEVSDVDLSDISEALEEYVRLFKAEIASPAEILTLSRAYPTEEKYSLAVIDKELDQNEPVVIGGPASVEVVDREGHLITLAAMKRAFERFMANFRTRNAMVLHSDVQVGWALPAYISKTGKIYKSGVTGDHLFFITELRDDTKIAKKVLEQIDTGKMKSYSIAGSATSVEAVQKSSGMVMQVNDMELAEVTICEQGVNQKAKFELMKSDADRPTSSCVDGSCLIKAQEHKHSETEIFMNSNGEIDAVGSFANWVQKESPRLAPVDTNKEIGATDEAAAKRAENRARIEAGAGDRQVSPYNKHSRRREKVANEAIEDMQKGIGDVARGAGKAVGAAVEGAKNVGSALKEGYKTPKVNDEGIITNLSPREAARRFKPVPMTERLAAHREKIIAQRDSKNMQKSHLEGCGCASCIQRTGDDDTARPATDRQGRPTLGHMGHGNVVAILISRMQRKADKNYDMDQFGSSGERDEAVWEDKLKGQPRLESTDENFQAWRKENPGAPSHLFPSKMQKAVYEYINKAFTPPSKEEQKEAADKRKDAALAAAKERYGEDFTPAKTVRRPYRGSAPRPQQTGDERKAAAQEAWRAKNPGQEDPASFANMQKAVYEYLHKNNIEKGALGAIGKVVGGAAKGASKVAGGVLSVADGLVGSEGGKSVLGNVTRVAGEAAGESKSNTPRMPGMELNMEKQAPEWTTPQTETPLSKFIENNKKDQD